jgi:hypothetical protein
MYLKRATKRNVYPAVIMNTVRFLNGTFNWKMSRNLTSIDIIFNQISLNVGVSKNHKPCNCNKDHAFFAIAINAYCPFCTGVSPYMSTETRISSAQALVDKTSTTEKHLCVDSNNKRSSKDTAKNHNRRLPGVQSNSNNTVLRDITNHSLRSPLCLAARPNDTELNTVTQPNNMLSNFVVSYFVFYVILLIP